MAALADRYGRTFPYLRLSLLEACNFRCSYCLPDGYRAAQGRASAGRFRPLASGDTRASMHVAGAPQGDFLRGAGDGRDAGGRATQGAVAGSAGAAAAGTPRWLTREEIARLLRGFAAVGLRKLRLTGGEPSLRVDLTSIIADAAGTPGIETVALTTNGIVLRRRFGDWHAAGLTALNVSLDSLDRGRFHAITGYDRGEDIRAGVELALASDLPALKLNAVLLRGLNDDELPAWLDYLRTRRLTVRFIELMQTGDNREYFQRHHLRADALERSLLQEGWSLVPRAATAGPAREYAHPDFLGGIGIIAPYSRDFCAGCNRLRVTASGDLRLCLFGECGIPLRPLLQSDDRLDELTATLHAQLGLKQAGHGLHEGRTGLTPHLASIGG